MKRLGWKFVLRACLIVFGGALLGTLLLTLAFLLPVNSEIHASSVAILEEEGWYPAAPVLHPSYETYFHSYLPGVLDDHTDRIMIDSALDESGEGSALYRAMNIYSDYLGKNYSRYWNGYVAILRPLMLFLDYGEIRVLNLALQVTLVLAIAFLIWKKKGWIYVAAFLTSYFLLMPLALGLSLQFSWVFYVTMIGTLILLKWENYFRQENRALYVFLVLGMATSYLDLLTYPLYTWAVPLLWWMTFGEKDDRRVRNVISTGLCWILGYGGLWCLKWGLATPVLGRNVWENGMEKVYAHSALGEAKWGILQRLEAPFVNWQHYSYQIYWLLLALWIGWFGLQGILKGWQKASGSLALGLVACAPAVWYLVLAEHTAAHHFFTYRLWGITVLAVLLLGIGIVREGDGSLWEILFRRRSQGKVYGERRPSGWPLALGNLLVWCGMAAAAWFLSLEGREERFVLNGDQEYELVAVPEDEELSFAFYPAFAEITELGLGLTTYSEEGSFELKLYQGEELLDHKSFPLEEMQEGTFFETAVDWTLQPEKEYRLALTTQGGTEESFCLVTHSDEMPLAEAGEVTWNGDPLGGQMILGVRYLCPLTGEKLIFLRITWMGIFLTLYFAGISLAQMIKTKYTAYKKDKSKVGMVKND